jgi:hypothetical protein
MINLNKLIQSFEKNNDFESAYNIALIYYQENQFRSLLKALEYVKKALLIDQSSNKAKLLKLKIEFDSPTYADKKCELQKKYMEINAEVKETEREIVNPFNKNHIVNYKCE